MSEVYIYDAVRTPRGRGKKDGSLHGTRPIQLARVVLEAIQQRNNIDTSKIDDVILGCVTQVAEQGGCIAKSAALYAGYNESVPGLTLNRFCGSGLEAINQAAANIKSGYFDCFVAGGVESMSRVPMGSDGGAWMIDPSVATETSFIPQGISADLIATIRGINRAHCDELAVASQERATKAWEEGYFDKSIIPIIDMNGIKILSQDEHIRPGTTVESLGKLKASFTDLGTKYGFDSVALSKYPHLESINHVHHAGNSSGIVDGASAVLLGNENIGKEFGIKPRAKIRSIGLVSTEPTIMLTGPAPATKKALAKAGMDINDIDLIEINEAFASVVINFLEELDIDMSNVNVNGGSIAMGHPLGATGAMLLGTLLDELERRDLSTGLVTLCIGGGMGIATIIERVN